MDVDMILFLCVCKIPHKWVKSTLKRFLQVWYFWARKKEKEWPIKALLGNLEQNISFSHNHGWQHLRSVLQLFLFENLQIILKVKSNHGKVTNADLHKLFEEIKKITEYMNQIVAKDKKLHSDLVIVKNVSCRLEEKIIYLK